MVNMMEGYGGGGVDTSDLLCCDYLIIVMMKCR